MMKKVLHVRLLESLLLLSLLTVPGTATSEESHSSRTQVLEDVHQWMSKMRSLEAPKDAERKLLLKKNRLLQEQAPIRSCGEVISKVTLDQVNKIADVIVDVLVPPRTVSPILVDAFKTTITNTMKFDFVAIKVCLSCDDVSGDLLGFDDSDEYGFASYCGPDAYARDAIHSAILFAPMNKHSGTIVPGAFRGFVSAPATRADLALAVTESWPRSLETILVDGLQSGQLSTAAFLFVYETFLAPVMAASAGTMSIVPDYLGYGESYEYNRTFFTKLPYERSISLSWLAAKLYLARSTNGCTRLRNIATMHGYGEGGYAIIPGAMALSKIGVDILSVHAGATPIDLVTQLDYAIELFSNTGDATEEDILHRIVVPNLVFGYSQDLPYLATAGTGERMVARTFDDPNNFETSLIQWFSAPDPSTRVDLSFLVPADPTVLIRPDFRALFQGALLDGVSNPFADASNSNAGRTALFQSVAANGLTETLKEVTFPLFLCHSPEDTVITIDNLPDFPFENSNVAQYAPVLDLLNPDGSHSTALLFCALDPALKLQQNSEARTIEPLDNDEQCLANPFPPTNPPVPEEDLTTAKYKNLEIDLNGLDILLDRGAFETLTELFIEDFFNFNSDVPVTHVESEVVVTDVQATEERRQRRLQTSNVTVTFDMTLTYLETGGKVDRQQLATAPFATEQQQEKFVKVLQDSEEETFQDLQSISALDSSACGATIVFTGILSLFCTMLI